MRFMRAIQKSLSTLSTIVTIVLVLISVTVVSMPAEARRFDMKTENFAPYFGGSYGPSNLSDGAFGASAGTGVQTDLVVRSNFAGEFGITLTSNRGGIRLAGEYILGQVSGVSGLSSSGTKYYSLTSKVSAFVPMVLAEAPIWKATESRIMLGGGLGYAFVSLDQTYTMTSAGTTDLGLTDFTEKAGTEVPYWRVYTSFETLFVDTATVLFEAGIRSIKVGAIQSSKDVTGLAGAETIGANLKNNDGTERSFDFGGGYISLLFRFYL